MFRALGVVVTLGALSPLPDETSFVHPGNLVDHAADWLMLQALDETPIEAVFGGCCERLAGIGVPLSRCVVGFRTLHPLYETMWIRWNRGDGTGTPDFIMRGRVTEAWSASPFAFLLRTGIPFLRRRLVGLEATIDFPVLEELRDDGMTDYLAYKVQFGTTSDGEEDGMIGSWGTDRDRGFSEADFQVLRRIQRRLAVVCKVRIKDQIAHNILRTYLGMDAGSRVLAGQIKRGDGETINAVIWYSDLRRSTPLAESMSKQEFLKILNTYFECTAGAVMEHGGEVLRFIGDAVLAIFPIQPRLNSREACEAALLAACDARNRMETVNAEREAAGEPALDFGLGLHLGEIMYGNIGVPERLEFSVIGAAANETARLEELTKTVGSPVVVSDTFANALPIAWQSLGKHSLRGVGQEMEVFAVGNGKTGSREVGGGKAASEAAVSASWADKTGYTVRAT